MRPRYPQKLAMMKFNSVLVQFLLAGTACYAAVNEPCVGSGGAAGVCVPTAECTNNGGTSISGACPADGADIKCCTKATCDNGANGNCRWTSDCGGSSVAGKCPGPGSYKCCSSAAASFGSYAGPNIPNVGSCKKVSVDGARKIVDTWPGRIREIGCFRENCNCDDSEHCCGLATDMMCSDEAGTATTSGRQIAEWVMHHREELNLKYVIWGQKIWNPSQDSVGNWTSSSWRSMEDRGDVTANHWDHVHVSYNR